MVTMDLHYRPGATWCSVLAALLLTAGLSACSPEADAPQPAAADAGSDTAESAVTGQSRTGSESTLAEPGQTAPGDSGVAANSRPATQAAANTPEDMLQQLTEFSWKDGSGDEVRKSQLLERLRQLGPDAVIPIRDALLDDSGSGAIPPALRQALLDVLLSLHSPEVESAALELLSGGVPASEVWQLGRYLEATQPGKYSEAILASAEQVLADADPSTVFPAEFFQLLGGLGDQNTAELLGGTAKSNGVYATIALAALPDGSGLPSLVQEAQVLATGRDTMEGRLALQLLAQDAPKFPEAAAALIALAEQGAIPANLWPYVLDIVAGNWELMLVVPESGQVVGTHTFFGANGNQLIYRVARQQNASADGLQDQRLYLLDRLQPMVPPELQLEPDG